MSESVVVIGAGMVGHRFADELVRLDRGAEYDVHLVGAESYEPYNRILLTEVVAGRSPWKALTLSRLPARVRIHRGVGATRIDRERQQVQLADGGRLGYDRLVLATGARAFVPAIAGLAGPDGHPRHVHVLRDLDDTRAVVSRAANAHHAVVLGGGVLGLEVACGLASRGVAVTVVQNEPQLMAGQVDAAPAAVLARSLDALGVRARLGTSVSEVISAYGELVAVRLTDETVLSTDLMIVSCGVRAETGLALGAGLPVDRGVVVGADLASPADERIFAVGDCAHTPEGISGLLAPGWAQAERLARSLTGAVSPASTVRAGSTEEPGPGRADIRLKAVGVDLVALGVQPSAAAGCDRVVTVDDPAGGRHISLVVRGDRLVGATALGAPEVAAELSVVIDRGTPLPVDPLALLTPERRAEEPSPVRMPSETLVCRCNNVTKQELVAAWDAGAETVEDVAAATRATTGCGGCTSVVCGVVDWLNAVDPTGTAGGPSGSSGLADGPSDSADEPPVAATRRTARTGTPTAAPTAAGTVTPA